MKRTYREKNRKFNLCIGSVFNYIFAIIFVFANNVTGISLFCVLAFLAIVIGAICALFANSSARDGFLGIMEGENQEEDIKKIIALSKKKGDREY